MRPARHQRHHSFPPILAHHRTTKTSNVTSQSAYALQQSETATTSTQKKQAGKDAMISPLTESNLETHTLTQHGCITNKGRHQRVRSYVQAQARLVRLEAEMQRRRMAEANAFVPLDTNSPEDQLVVRLTPAGSTTASLKSKKKSMSKLPSTTFGRWFRRNKSTGQDQSSPVASHDSAHSHHRHHQSMDEKPSSATSFPHTTATSMSDRASFEQYQYDKWTLIQEGLKGLSNSNIAHALGANNPHSHNHNRHSSSLISVLFSTSATESSSSAAAAAVLANKEPKRDSGISLFAALSSSSSSKKKAHQIHREPPSEPANSPQQISCDSDGFLALRYPCMVHLQTLRSAAIHVLSSDMTLDTSVHTPRSSCCISESNKNSCCCPSTPATTPQPS